VIFENDKIVGQPGDGQYVKRPVKYHYKNEFSL